MRYEGYEGYEGYARGTSFPAPRLLSLSRANFHLRGNRAPHLPIFRPVERQIGKAMEIRSDFLPLCSQIAFFPATPKFASLLAQRSPPKNVLPFGMERNLGASERFAGAGKHRVAKAKIKQAPHDPLRQEGKTKF